MSALSLPQPTCTPPILLEFPVIFPGLSIAYAYFVELHSK